MEMEKPRLELLLDSHRDAIHLLPGVVGTGIGFSPTLQSGAETVIQIFVESADRVGSIRQEAKRMLGEVPFEVIVTGEATAGGRTHQ